MRAAWWIALAAVSAMLLAPLLIADVPPLLDYPNHLARLALLAAGPDDPVLGPMFTPRWAIIPNLAGDTIGLALLRILPIHIAGRCLLAGILLLNLTGVIALHRALFGRRSFWPLLSGLVAYNSTFLLGFLNWQIACGLAMPCAAGWLRWRDSRPVPTIAAAIVAATVLFFCHLMGLVFFLLLIAGAELYAARTIRQVLRRGAALCAVAAGPIVLASLTTLQATPTVAHWPRLDVKLVNAASPFINYVFALDMVTAVLVYGGIGLGLATGRLILAPRAAIALTIMPVAYFLLPFDLNSGSFLDMRFAVMFGFLLFAAVDRASPNRFHRGLAIVCASLLVARMAVVAQVWTQHRSDLNELRATIAGVPPGANVYVTNVPQEEAPAYWDAGPRARRLSNGLRADYHLPALLLIERNAFWPGLFANPAQQPIQLTPRRAMLAREAHDIPSHADLVTEPDRALPALRDFDFVLMLEAGADPGVETFLAGCLSLVKRTDFAALFRVTRDAPRCAPGRP